MPETDQKVSSQPDNATATGAAAPRGTLTDPLASSLADPLITPLTRPAQGTSASTPLPPPGDPGGGTRNPNLAASRFRVPTWDAQAKDPVTGQAGLWVDAEPAKGDASALRTGKSDSQPAADKRMFQGVDKRSENEAAADATALQGGHLDADEVKNLSPETARNINPLSDVPKNILTDAFHATWSHAKHELIGEGPGPEAVMKKLWEYRQWHHNAVLEDVQHDMAHVDNGKGLEKWAAAGSTSLTSDIDINLKGTATEAAVAAFNSKFKRDFPYESGVVYDVNVYALDFMQGNTFGGLFEGEGASRKQITGKEGKREGRNQGGFSDSLQGKALQRSDAADQETWALTKMRLYMTEAEWAAFKKSTDPEGKDAGKHLEVERKFRAYCDEILAGMGADVSEPLEAADRLSGMDQLKARASAVAQKKMPDAESGGASENALMSAQNRAYEKKLPVIKALRDKLAKNVGKYNAAVQGQRMELAEILEMDIDADLATLRRLLAEGNLFANEAYVTDGGVNHTVIGMQAGLPVAVTNTESLNAITENVADILKELKRHDASVGEAMYKGGKYFFRLGDAALNLGAQSVEYVTEFYDLGYKLANEVKGGEGTDNLQKSFELTKQYLGVNGDKPANVAAIMQIVRTVGARITSWYKANIGEEHASERGGAASLKNKRADVPAPDPYGAS
jgi:hypothetical protein